jgi:hypothetical protein
VTPNRYFICLGQGSPPIPWELSDTSAPVRFDCVYFGRVFQAMETRLHSGGFTVYLTWDVRELPQYGEKVVAVVLGDEDSRVPRYADAVGAVFKCYGARPFVGGNPLRERSRLSALVLIQGCRRLLRHLPDDVWVARRRLAGGRLRPVDHIPLGYYNQLDLPTVDFDARATSLFFAGSLEQRCRSRLSPRRYLSMPKPVARQEMLEAVRLFERRRPDVPIKLRLTPTFDATSRADAEPYSRDLMNAKICLAPRGANVETFRFFEALRSGCVVITERLPSTRFYDGSPAVTIQRWRDLPDVLERLLDDKDALRERHELSLAWWRDRCSEAAVGTFMADRLEGRGHHDVPPRQGRRRAGDELTPASSRPCGESATKLA